jgi:hypothetical protein
MYDDFVKVLEELRKLTGDERSAMTTWLVIEGLLLILRYVLTGVVVFLLGRRMINAFAYSMKDVRDQETRS